MKSDKPKSMTDREILRNLATKVREAAGDPRMPAVIKRWKDVNALRKPDRAPVWCRPVGCWKEILPPESLECVNREHRTMEYRLRQTLHKYELGDDTPIYAQYDVPAVFDTEPANIWGIDIGRKAAPEADGAWAYDPPVREREDMNRLRIPRFTFNLEKTRKKVEFAGEIIGDILKIHTRCAPKLTTIICLYAAELRGLEQMMIDMITEPDMLHDLMKYLQTCIFEAMDAAEDSGMLTPNTDQPMTCSDPLRPDESTGDGYTWRDMWCLTNSQEFDQVSPAMWEEFCLEYQKPMLERFGMVGYGCCENLTKKIDGVLSIPNLRIFTCSAWTDLETVLSKAGTDYCIMWRQKASDVVMPHDTDTIRKDLHEGTRRLRGHYYQIVLRELQTLYGHPDRLHDWTRFAIEAAEENA